MTKPWKNLLDLLVVVTIPLLMSVAFAQKKVARTTPAGKGLSQDIDFSDQLIQGRYHYSDEAVVNVENEKYLDDLLGVRKNFKDRIKAETKRY